MPKVRRYHLKTVATQTKHLLLLLLVSLACVLFVLQLFLMNRLSMAGYVLTREVEQNAELALAHEKFDSQIAKAQTQEYVTKTSSKQHMTVKENQQFVYVPLNFTAKR